MSSSLRLNTQYIVIAVLGVDLVVEVVVDIVVVGVRIMVLFVEISIVVMIHDGIRA